MRRRVVVWFAVVVAVLVATAAPASAASVASINTTAQDFQSASLDDMEIQGSGESASVTANVGTSALISYVMSDTVSQTEHGAVFEVSSHKGAVRVDIYDAGVVPNTVYLRYHSNGTLIKSESVSTDGSGAPQPVAIDADLQPGVEYRVTADRGGGDYDHGVASRTTPDSSDGLTVSHGYDEFQGGEVSTVQVFSDIAVADAFDVRYTGDPHTAEGATLFANVSTNTTTTVTAQANDGSGWTDLTSTTISSDQNVTFDISGSSATQYRTVVSASREQFERTVSIHDEGVTFTSSSPSLSDPTPPDGATDVGGTDLSINATDADFGLAQSDIVTVAVSNQNGQVAQKQTNTNGTLTFDYTALAGANNITYTATDEYGNRDTLTANFSTGATLTFVNESAPSQIVQQDIEVSVDLLGQNQTLERSTTTGRINLGGVPLNAPIIVDVETNSTYADRVIYLQSLREQRRVYLLNESAINTTTTRFDLSDPTGQFGSDSIFFVQKSINVSGSTEFRTVHADRFGVEGVTVTLEEDARYRTKIRNVNGETQDTGPYRADASETVTVRPGTPSLALSPGNGSWAADATLDNQTLEFRYRDDQQATDRLDIYVYEKGNPSNILGTNRTYFNLGNVSGTYALTANQSNTTWVVAFDIDRGDESYLRTVEVGNRPDLVPSLDPVWRLIIGVSMLFVSAGAYSLGNAAVGGVTLSLTGGVVWWLGFLPGATAGAAVVFALLISIAYHVYTGSRV